MRIVLRCTCTVALVAFVSLVGPTAVMACGSWTLWDHERNWSVNFSGIKVRIKSPTWKSRQLILWSNQDLGPQQMAAKLLYEGKETFDSPSNREDVFEFDGQVLRSRGSAAGTLDSQRLTIGNKSYEIRLTEPAEKEGPLKAQWDVRVREGRRMSLSGTAAYICDGSIAFDLATKREITTKWIAFYMAWRDLLADNEPSPAQQAVSGTAL